MIGRFPLNLLDPIQYNSLTRPFGIAYDSAGGRIAIVDVTNSNVVFLNATTLATITTVHITPVVALSMVALDPSGNRFFITDDHGEVSVISGTDYSVSSFVNIPPTADNPTCRAIRIADTRIFFSCYFTGTGSSKIFVYNLSTAALITSFAVNSACGMEIADSKIWVSCHGANNVLVYNLTTYSLITTIAVGVDCYTLANDPDLDYMIINSRDSDQLKLLRRSDSTIVGAMAGIAGSNDSVFIGGKIYTTLQSTNKLAIIERFYS